MSKKYSEKEIINKVKERLFNNPHFFYTENFLKYKSKTQDTKEPCTEVIAKVLVDHYGKVKLIGKNALIRRTKSFNWNHNGISNVAARLKRYGYLKYSEKLLAIALFNSQDFFCVGKIFDYEVPLNENISDGFGKIDIVTEDNDQIRLIELKISKEENDETLLRALLEIYTYYKLISNSNSKFIQSFPKDLNNKIKYYFRPAILTDMESLSGTTIKEIKHYPYLKELVSEMNKEIGVKIEFFVYNYPSKQVKTENRKIVLDGDINIRKVTY